MLYSRYVEKIRRIAEFLKKVYVHKVPIIITLAAVLITTGSLVAAKGLIVSDVTCPTQVVYGESLNYTANAFLAKVTYEYAPVGQDAWTETAPTEVGTYRVRAVGKAAFGAKRYSDVYTYTIAPRPLPIQVSDATVMYGEMPAVTAELVYGDVLNCSVVFDDPYAVNAKDVTATTNAHADLTTVTLTNAAGKDVAHNYAVSTPASPICITPRPLQVTVEDLDKVYDGVALTFDGYEITEGTLAGTDRHTATYTMPTELTDVGTVVIEPTITIVGASGQDVTRCYDLTIIQGKLCVTPRPLLIEVTDAELVYNGLGQSSTAYTLSPTTTLVSGHRLEVKAKDSFRDVGVYQNYLDLWVVDASGKHQTDNYISTNGKLQPGTVTTPDAADESEAYSYSIFIEVGKLTITPRRVTISTPTESLVYDGQIHEYREVTVEGMAPTDRFDVITWTSVRDVTNEAVENRATVEFWNTVDDPTNTYDPCVTSNYEIVPDYGNLTVTKRPVTIITSTERWVYDGEFHEYKENIQIGGHGIAPGEIWYAESTRVRNVTAGTPNEATVRFYRIEDIGEVETTSNYDITEYEFGNLIVDPRPITVTTPDASWLYDGMVHSLDNLDDIIIGGDGIAPADLVSLNDYTSVRNATAGTPNEASIHIQQYEESGENLVDARDNYAIEYIPGTIVVEPRAILLVTEGYEDVYDGETYYLSAEIFGDGVAPGDGYEIINTPTVRDVTDRINDAGVRFYPMDGSTVSDEEMAPNTSLPANTAPSA